MCSFLGAALRILFGRPVTGFLGRTAVRSAGTPPTARTHHLGGRVISSPT